MTLYYTDVRGLGPNNLNWQMGMYSESDTLNATGAFNAWTAFLTSFFISGTIHAFGYYTLMAPSQITTLATLYIVDEATDRKAVSKQAAFAGTGTSTNTVSYSAQICILALLRPVPQPANVVGRLYLPPTSQGLYGSTIGSTLANEILDFLQDAFSDFTSNNLHPVVRNRSQHTSTRVGSYSISSIPAVHKSRVVPLRPTYFQRTI